MINSEEIDFMVICPNCNNDYNDDFNFCPYCGLEKQEILICPICRFQSTEYSFCPNCGEKLLTNAEIEEDKRKNELKEIVFSNSDFSDELKLDFESKIDDGAIRTEEELIEIIEEAMKNGLKQILHDCNLDYFTESNIKYKIDEKKISSIFELAQVIAINKHGKTFEKLREEERKKAVKMTKFYEDLYKEMKYLYLIDDEPDNYDFETKTKLDLTDIINSFEDVSEKGKNELIYEVNENIIYNLYTLEKRKKIMIKKDAEEYKKWREKRLKYYKERKRKRLKGKIKI